MGVFTCAGGIEVGSGKMRLGVCFSTSSMKSRTAI